jgi:hypothetical protein
MNELQSLSPLLAGIGNVNVFTVPAGYFEQLAGNILTGIQEENGSLPLAVPGVASMQVPQGYFDNLAGNILGKIRAQEDRETELMELSPLLHGISKKNVFTVPQGYFESLAADVLNKVKVATGDNVQEELKQLSPILYDISNKNVFTVPAGYFDSVAIGIIEKVTPQPARLVTMQRRTPIILKYAVAAVFTGLIALGVFKYIGGLGGEKVELPAYVAEGGKIKNVDEALSKISDDDIIKYLQVNGTDVDAALVASTVDEKELPSQEDYLTDDKALDKYLDNIDLTELKN